MQRPTLVPAVHVQATYLARDVACMLAQTDPRIAAPVDCSAGLKQRLGATLLRAEASVVVIEGKPDIFAFSARSVALRVAHEWIEEHNTVEARSELSEAQKLLLFEEQKLTREQALPVSAAGLLHEFSVLYPLSADSASVLARRLGEIEDSLDGAALDALDAWALEDALASYETHPALVESVTSLRLALRAFDLVAPQGTRIERLAARGFTANETKRIHALRTSFQRSVPAERKPEGVQPSLVALLHGTNPEVLRRVSLLVSSKQCSAQAAPLCHDVLTLGLWADALARDRAAVRDVASKVALWSNDLEPSEKDRLLRRTAADPLPFLEIARAFLVP